MPVLPVFSTDGLLSEPPGDALKARGWSAGDESSLHVTNWLAQRTGEALAAADSLTSIGGLAGEVSYALDLYTGSPPSSLDISSAVYDPVEDIYIFALTTGSPTREIWVSDDGLQTATMNRSDAVSPRLDNLAIVPGEWAFGSVDNSTWYSSAQPYTSWTYVTSATFTPSNMGVGYCVTTLDGVASLVVSGFTAGTAYIAHTPTATRPTVAGDWTELTPATMSHVFGIATDGVINVLAGSVGGTTPTIAYAGIADGGLSGDWTTVTIGGGNYVRDIAYDGKYFVIVDDAGDAYQSEDAITWTKGATAGGSSQHFAFAVNPDSGLIVSYSSQFTGRPVYASRDGASFVQVQATSNFKVYGDFGRFAFNPKTNRLVAGDGATVDSILGTG